MGTVGVALWFTVAALVALGSLAAVVLGGLALVAVRAHRRSGADGAPVGPAPEPAAGRAPGRVAASAPEGTSGTV